MTEIRPAPKHLALLAANTRGWDYEEIYAAIIAAGHAGWTFEQVYREVTRLILIKDATPASLRHKAARPAIGSTGAEVNQRGKELALEAYRQTRGAQERPGDPEGGEAA